MIARASFLFLALIPGCLPGLELDLSVIPDGGVGPGPIEEIPFTCLDAMQAMVRVQDENNFEGCAVHDPVGSIPYLACVKQTGDWAASRISTPDGFVRFGTVVTHVVNQCGGLLGDFAYDIRAAIAPDGSGRWCATWAIAAADPNTGTLAGPCVGVMADCYGDN